MNKAELVEKILGETISNDIKGEMDKLKSEVYKNLWKENSKSGLEIETPFNHKIIVSKGRISFDSGKTYIHRSEEKLIKEKLDKLEKDVVKHIISDLTDELDSELEKRKNDKKSRVEKTRAEKTRADESRVDDDTKLLNSLLGILDHVPDYVQKNIFHSTTLLSELKIIDEQIALLREIGGNKDKLLALLEEKHKVLKELKHL